jgi:hypothetical protein
VMGRARPVASHGRTCGITGTNDSGVRAIRQAVPTDT